MEVPSSVAGVVKELKVKVGDSLSEGKVVALIEVAEGGPERGPWLMARLQQEAGGGKVSWQSEQRLRFAGKGLTAKGLRAAVTAAGLQVTGVRRLRIGRVALGPLPPGQWRYLGSDERF
jgi:23S rRNA pseudouridine2604 synthase